MPEISETDLEVTETSLKNSKIKKSMPLLSFPSVQFLNCSVNDLVVNSDLQAKGMKIVADLSENSFFPF